MGEVRERLLGRGGMTGAPDKRTLSERDICTKFITPAFEAAGWDRMNQVREEVGCTKGRITVRGKLVSRGQPKRADYVLSFQPNLPIAVIEAKDNRHSVGDGIQQALGYAATSETAMLNGFVSPLACRPPSPRPRLPNDLRQRDPVLNARGEERHWTPTVRH